MKFHSQAMVSAAKAIDLEYSSLFRALENLYSTRPPIERFDGTKYAFLSNFYYSPIRVAIPYRNDIGADGGPYLAETVEHAYQASKYLDFKQANKILEARSAGLAKRLGQKPGKRLDWENIKINVMHRFVWLKFYNHQDLGKKLIDTGDAELIEGNTWGDTFWGVYKGKGQNHLGRVLMRVRDELQS